MSEEKRGNDAIVNDEDAIVNDEDEINKFKCYFFSFFLYQLVRGL